ncbi:MAG: DUF58 domain-containing protein [Bacteroidota bacterium]
MLKKVRQIEIRTRGLSRDLFSGEYHSAFKGRGMAFSEVRDYTHGDDIRTIDWNVTARFNHPFVKVFEEEREMNLMLLVDVSGSEDYGARRQFKRDLITELSAVLAFSAVQNNDKIGVIFFSDKVEKFIPPKKGRSHTLRIIRELLDFQPENKKTDIAEALRFLSNVAHKRNIVFALSDFISRDFDEALRIVSRRHDTVALRICDRSEEELPDLGLIKAYDAESGEIRWVDTSSRKVRESYREWWLGKESRLREIFLHSNVDEVKIRTDESYIAPLMAFFRQRGNRR